MDFKHAAKLKAPDLYKGLKTSQTGLSPKEAQNRLAETGENKIKFQEVTSFDIFKRQFKSPFVYLLLASSALSFFFGEIIDAGMILLFVFINTALGFYQEYKSEQTVKLLKKYLASKIRVLREGKISDIDVSLLVPGDIILLEPGDVIPADVRFIEDYNLNIDETVLTGESVQVTKSSSAISKNINDIYDAGNIGFSGTTVVGGTGRAVVFATGTDTNYAQIVKLTAETVKESSFEKEIVKFSKFTLWVVLATLIFIVVTSIAVKPDPSLTELVIFSIALAVSVIPEALPVVTTFSLSIGAYNLTKKRVVVKRLTSVEDLGSLQVLATDKTGTLTQNKMEISNVFSEDRDRLLLFARLSSYFSDNSRNAGNSAFDIALENGLSRDLKSKLKGYGRLNEIPFDPERKRVTTLVKSKSGTYLISRGSPEEIIKLCKNHKNEKQLLEWVQKEGVSGRRSLAVAIKEVSTGPYKDISKLEGGMDFLGMISFTDPIKPSAYRAIKEAKELGVHVKIITGDSREVAGQVALEIDLIKDINEVITGQEFEKLDIDEKHAAIDRYSVFARIIPAQKHQIVSLLKERYYTGFLGEGINDAPALKASNVAVVVEGASDVAKEAADIVLLEKDLEVIMQGISEGRRVFANTSKYITATMASNFGNFFAVALIAPFISFLPMLPLQILLVNLLSDFPMIMVATDNVDDDVVRTPKKYNLRGFAASALSFGFISTAFDFVVFSTFYKHGEANLQTYWFIESILSELLFLFSIRTAKPLFLGKAPSKPLIVLTFITFILTFAIPFTGVGRSVFGFIKPEAKYLLWLFGIVIAYIAANEVAKYFLRKWQKN